MSSSFYPAFFILFFASALCSAQINPATNSAYTITSSSVHSGHSTGHALRGGPTGLPCTPNTFYATNSAGIYSYTLIGNTVISNGLVTTGGGSGFAVANNISGGSYSPTFYAAAGGEPSYYDGSAWVTSPAGGPFISGTNIGGNGDYLYYMNGLSSISRYDGTNITQIHSASYGVADIAVLDNGNFVVMTEGANRHSIFLLVISPTGQVVQQIPFVVHVDHAYGAMTLNNTVYFAFGSSNDDFPDMLVPILISGGTATTGTPIPFSGNSLLDLASCAGGPQCPTISVALTPSVTRSGLNTGAIKAIASGGTSPYTYSLDNTNFQGNNIFTNLPLGTYQLYVTDSSGCTAQQAFTIDAAGCCGGQ